MKAGPTGSLFGSVTPSDIADEIWRARKVRVDRRKIAIDPLKRIGRYAIPIELFQDVTVEVKTLVVPEGGELPPEEELAALEAAEAEAAAAAAEEAESRARAKQSGDRRGARGGGARRRSRRGRRGRVNPRPKPLRPTSSRRRRLPDITVATRVATTIAIAGAIALVCAAAAFAQDASKTRVTVIGDSIAASFDYVPAARRYLGKGLDLRSDAVVCRRLVATSCPFQGSTPSTALQVVGSKRSALGPVVVINVGYNDWPAVYDVDRVMRALKAAGVRR